MATYQEAFPKALEYFKNDELAAGVFLSKYALTDQDGDIVEQTPEASHRRMAKEFARIEKKYPNPMSEDEIFGYMDQYKYIIAQGSPTSAIGNPYQIMSTSNCFVTPSPLDSYGGICYTDQQLVQIAKRRGGIGFDISNIRPKGQNTSNAAKTTDGIGIFMQRYSNSCREVGQEGRRGALMLTISVHHPEIKTFIKIKKDKTKVTGANISIRLSDEFMNAVVNDTDVELRWPCEPESGQLPKISKMVKAKEIWNEIIDSAWADAEPGILFWDTIIRNSPADIYSKFGFKTISTNPCSELPLSPDSCRLMLTNLLSFVGNPFTPKAYFDFELFNTVVQKAQRLMDDLVDLEIEHIEKIIAKIKSDPEPDHIKFVELSTWNVFLESCKNGRRTGLGVTAVGDTVAALGMKYGSKESIEFVGNVMFYNARASYYSSIIMAKERGAFPVWNYELEKNHVFVKKIINIFKPEVRMIYQKYGRRNIANNTIAPVGSQSMLAKALELFGTTSGIENATFLESIRRKKKNPSDKAFRVDFVDQSGDEWQEFKVYHAGFRQWMEITGKTDPKESPYDGSTIKDLDWPTGVDLQAAAQEWVDHAISRTVNLPSDVSRDVVAEVYLRGWKAGLKGMTVYRDGCRSGVILSADSKKEEKPKFEENHAPKRPTELPCDIHHVSVKGKPFTVLVGKLDVKPYEIFGGHPLKDLSKSFKDGKIVKVSHGKTKPATYNLVVKNGHEEIIEDINGVFDNPTQGAFTRVLSTALRHGTPIQYLSEQVLKGEKDSSFTAFSKVIARVLKTYIKDGTKSSGDKTCQSCGKDGLVYQEGCLRCTECSASKCG